MISTKDPNVVPVSSPLPLNKGRGLRCGDCYGSRRSRFQPSPSPSPWKGEATHVRHRVGGLLKKEIEALQKSAH